MLTLVVDTNLFHEFRPLDTLPWSEITDTDEIILLVSDPVQTELDEQKKSSKARIKRRALEWVKRFRELLKAGKTDLVVVEGSPRVVLRLDDTRPSKEHENVLDLTVRDDAIVAIAVHHQDGSAPGELAIFSDDLRPMRKARQVGLEFIEIPDGWRRDPEQTEEDKEKQRLKEQIALLKRQEPDLKLSCSLDSPSEFVLPIYEPMTEDQIEELMQLWTARHPIETNFERAKDSLLASSNSAAALGLNPREFRAASEQDIAQYKEDQYPAWLERCREKLSEAHLFFSYIEQSLTLDVELCNQGTRPADDLQITISTLGGLSVMPDPATEADEDEATDVPSFDLPPPPEAPQGKWVTIDPFESIFGRKFGGINPFASPYLGPTLQNVLRENQRDPNHFYYRNRPSEPVASYSLTCKQFRHAGPPEVFCLLVRPDCENVKALEGKNALLEVACNASNLSDFDSLRLSLKLKVEAKSTYDLLLKKIGRDPFNMPTGLFGSD